MAERLVAGPVPKDSSENIYRETGRTVSKEEVKKVEQQIKEERQKIRGVAGGGPVPVQQSQNDILDNQKEKERLEKNIQAKILEERQRLERNLRKYGSIQEREDAIRRTEQRIQNIRDTGQIEKVERGYSKSYVLETSQGPVTIDSNNAAALRKELSTPERRRQEVIVSKQTAERIQAELPTNEALRERFVGRNLYFIGDVPPPKEVKPRPNIPQAQPDVIDRRPNIRERIKEIPGKAQLFFREKYGKVFENEPSMDRLTARKVAAEVSSGIFIKAPQIAGELPGRILSKVKPDLGVNIEFKETKVPQKVTEGGQFILPAVKTKIYTPEQIRKTGGFIGSGTPFSVTPSPVLFGAGLAIATAPKNAQISDSEKIGAAVLALPLTMEATGKVVKPLVKFGKEVVRLSVKPVPLKDIRAKAGSGGKKKAKTTQVMVRKFDSLSDDPFERLRAVKQFGTREQVKQEFIRIRESIQRSSLSEQDKIRAIKNLRDFYLELNPVTVEITPTVEKTIVKGTIKPVKTRSILEPVNDFKPVISSEELARPRMVGGESVQTPVIDSIFVKPRSRFTEYTEEITYIKPTTRSPVMDNVLIKDVNVVKPRGLSIQTDSQNDFISVKDSQLFKDDNILKYKTNQVQTFNQPVIQLSSQNSSQKSKQQSSQKSAFLQLDFNKVSEVLKTNQKSRQVNKQKFNDDFFRENTKPRTPEKPKPVIFPKPKGSTSEGFDTNKFLDSFKTAYEVQIRRKGQFVPIADNLPIGKAIKIGSEQTQSTLAATFRLIPKGKTTKSDIDFRIDKDTFRLSKNPTTSLEFVEKRSKRLSTGSEVSEIHFFKKKTGNKKTGKKKSKKGGNMFGL